MAAGKAVEPGGTVVQLYCSQVITQAMRPQQMLLAFAKVERSTSTTVTLTIPVDDLGYYQLPPVTTRSLA